MKKEMLIAVVIGFLFGLLITYGIYRLRISSGRQSSAPIASPVATATPSEADSSIVIHSPIDGQVQKEKNLTVTGSTIPDSYIVLFVNNADYIRKSDEDGNFSFEVTLEDGSNLLTLQALTNDGRTFIKERTVVVTTLYEQSEDELATMSAQTTPTPRATAAPR